MAFVMIPVPAELVLDVMQHVVRIVAAAEVEGWDADAAADLHRLVDASGQALLAAVSDASLADEDLYASAAATATGVSIREVAALVSELNSVARDMNRPAAITTRVATERTPDGEMAETRILLMDRSLAGFVRAAASATPGVA